MLECLNAFDNVDRRGPLLVTYEWLKNAARVRKRALTKGRVDLYEDVCKYIDKNTYPDERDEPRQIARKFFGLDEDEFWIRGRHDISRPDNYVHEGVDLMLKKYRSEGKGSWKHKLYTMQVHTPELSRLHTRSST